MKELNFDNGLKTYTVNGCAQISFNPSDARFNQKMHALLKRIEEIVNDNPELSADDADAYYAFMNDRDRAIRNEVDAVFGDGISDKIFPYDCTAVSDGMPMVVNFLLAILDEVESNVDEQTKAASPRVAHYTAKWQKYAKKK